jgi:hypothetical protein
MIGRSSRFFVVRLAGRAVPEGTDNREAKAERE